MKLVLINKSDSTGGAAVVTRRLAEALIAQGHEVKMLVAEKLTHLPFVEKCAPDWKIKFPFLKERLGIFIANGFNRKTLFKIDTADAGLPLWKHPAVKDADAILLNWVNQGMLSLKGIGKLLDLGKPVAWTMHDMWNMTGVCHHAGTCRHYRFSCGDCPLLGRCAKPLDISERTWQRKSGLYSHRNPIRFVAVSNWLKEKAGISSLLKGHPVTVIPNAFPLPKTQNPTTYNLQPTTHDPKIRILFGAARLDDPIKGLPALREMTKALRENHPGIAGKLELATFGGVKDPASLEGFAIPHVHLGILKGEDAVRKAYEESQILVSASHYETLPGTLVEAQAYGCIPVAFDSGGQRDIITDGETGFLFARPEGDEEEAGRLLADGVAKAVGIISSPQVQADFRSAMLSNVRERFSPSAVANAYVTLLQ